MYINLGTANRSRLVHFCDRDFFKIRGNDDNENDQVPTNLTAYLWNGGTCLL